jgi:TPP-dependent pyruvate/acetoin dehydrogenase alpha subunit
MVTRNSLIKYPPTVGAEERFAQVADARPSAAESVRTTAQPIDAGELDLLAVYRAAYQIRHFEERARDLRKSGQITCSLHLCIGQEQIAIASRAALAEGDVVFATYRGHHWGLACGIPLTDLFAEFMGRQDGINGGRAGAGFFVASAYGFMGENGIVGAGAPIATGAALASQFDDSGRVSLVAFGDGALNQGAMHEAMNFAAIFDLGVVFLCENNGYAEYTPTDAMFRIARLSDRAAAYGFPGETVDGADPSAIHDAVKQAAERARAGEGPTLLEVRVRRLEGHHTHDAEHYRPPGEKAAWREEDSLSLLRHRLVADGTTEEAIARVEREVLSAIDEAVARADASPPADAATVLEHVHG